MKRKETVTRIIDGDTFETSCRKRPVRLANVNAPEKRTRGGPAATKALSSLIAGKKIEVTTVARDIYGRAVSRVKVDGKSVNATMRRKGYK